MSSSGSGSEEEEAYEVENIVNKRFKGGKVQYYVKWKGYDSEENTWEPVEHLDCAELIAEYESQKRDIALGKDEKKKPAAPPAVQKTPTPAKKAKQLRGFARGLKAEKIIGATNDPGSLYFLLKWKGVAEPELVKAKEANVKIPQVVIQFYEDRLNWDEEELPEAASTGDS